MPKIRSLEAQRVGAFISHLRARVACISQKEMAARVGVHLNTYQHYEAGETDPPMKVLRLLSRELHVPVSRLVACLDDSFPDEP